MSLSMFESHSRTLKHPNYTWGCQGLYRERDETPEDPESHGQIDLIFRQVVDSGLMFRSVVDSGLIFC